MVAVSEVTDADALDRLEGDWRDLLARAGDPTPFQSHEWQATWWRHHGRGRLWVLVAHDNGVMIGLMPLHIMRYRGTPLRQVRFLGAPLSDFQEILAARGHEGAARDAFMAHLAAHSSGWDLCDFADQRKGTSLTVGEMPDGLRPLLVHHRVCPFIPLVSSWDEQAKRLSKNMRTNVGRRRRQVAKEFRAEYDLATVETVTAAMEELFRLHNARWRRRGVAGAFAGARMQAFHHEVARKFLQRGWLRLHRLRLDGETRAAFYCFQLGRRVYYYLSGFDVAFGKFSIGNVLMAQAIERAIGDGATEFDLLRGDEVYKFAWKAEERETLRLIIGRPALRSSFALGAHRFERFIELKGLALQRRLWGRKKVDSRQSTVDS
ncbi:MAG: Protein involved in cellulose biosynthesis (CelD) [bacterium]|nr:Protein involved in cellulose biosynthesis (CelD) [bacterium]